MKKWVKRGGNGALWLLVATLLTKLIGVLQKIPLQNVGGDAVFGIYNMVYPLYQLMLVLAVTGIPTAISAIVADQSSQQRQHLSRVSHSIMIIIGIVLGVLMYMLSSPLAGYLGSSDLTGMIEIIALTIVIAPLLASYRGYYQGIKLASYSSISQLIEQVIRVAIMVIVLYIGVYYQWNAVTISTNVMWGGVVGASIAVMYLYRVKRQTPVPAIMTKLTVRIYKQDAKQIIKYALPAALAAVIVPLIAVIDTITIPRLLANTLSFSQLAEQFGLYSRIQPLVQLVTMMLAATIAGTLPNLVEKQSQTNNFNHVKPLLDVILRYTIVIGAAASVGLYMLAEPISIMLYKDTVGIMWFKGLAWMTLPASVLAVITPLLLLQRQIVWLVSMVIVSVIIKVSGNLLLINNHVTMDGAVQSTLITLYVVAIMGLSVVYGQQRLETKAGSKVFIALKCLLALVLMGFTLKAARLLSENVLHMTLENRLYVSLYVIVLVLLGVVVLLTILKQFKLISKQQLKQIMK